MFINEDLHNLRSGWTEGVCTVMLPLLLLPQLHIHNMGLILLIDSSSSHFRLDIGLSATSEPSGRIATLIPVTPYYLATSLIAIPKKHQRLHVIGGTHDGQNLD